MFQSENLELTLNDNGLAELCFKAPGSVNKLALKVLQEFEQALAQLSEVSEPVQGLLLYSDKESFIVGADITEFLDLFALPEQDLRQWLIKANGIFSQLEDLPFPTLSAIRGFALGGGMELILATDFRVVDETAQLGLPETKLGIMPGFGGTVRLPRVIGADNAMEWITTGKTYNARQSFAVGAADAVVDSNQLLVAARAMLLDAASGQLNWKSRRQAKLTSLQLPPIEALMSFSTAKAMVAAKAGPHYPAPMMAVNTIEKAASMERDSALAIELEGFVKLAHSCEAQALVGLFLNDQQLKRIAKKASSQAHPIHQAAVLGAGIMGGGIAYQAAHKGTPVIMKDIHQDALQLGLSEANKLLTKQVERGKLSLRAMGETLSRITPTLSTSALSQTDIVVEAVVENPKIKAAVLAEVEQNIGPKAILTSNTSTISIDQLAASVKDPSRFCGMHFFNPVHRMPLVEVIRGQHTSDETIATVVSWAAQMGKSPVVVNDCPGFFVNRVLFPYFHGFTLLVQEGVDFERIDKVMERQFGWPMGPAYLLDVVGIDTAHHAREVMADGFPERMPVNHGDAIDLLYQAKCYGQKSGSGFYSYESDSKGKPIKKSCEQTKSLLQSTDTSSMTDESIMARMMIPLILETIRCLEEKVIASPAEADMALVYGLGFPPFRGGVFRYLETLGLSKFINMARAYEHLGPLYQVTPTMMAMDKQQQSYLGLRGDLS